MSAVGNSSSVVAAGWRYDVRSFWTALRMGWRIEANWTDPFLFFVYSVAKPLAAALILVVMIDVVSGGALDREYRAFVVVGSALWAFVISGASGLAWSILDDRERYRVLKYLYVSPANFIVLLLGRGMARVAVGAVGAIITLIVGIAFLGVPFEPTRVDWLFLAVSCGLGVVAVVALGLLLAAVVLQTRQESWEYPEAVTGALFLVVGAVFPLAVIPAPVQVVGLLSPLTWWLAAVRDSLFPGGISSLGGDGSLFVQLSGAAAPSRGVLVIALLATTAVVTLLAAILFRWSERRAKDRGLLDLTTGS